MAIITTPGAGVSPYETTTTTPAVLRAGADGSTTLAAVADTATTGANTSVYVSGQAALNSLITSSQPGVFEGANVTINLEEQLFNTTNQVTATTNYPSGDTGEIQYNSGSNSFASSAYFTYTSGNVIAPGIRTDGYFYSNGAPFTGGGNAAIGNFVFTGDNMTVAHANSTLSVTGNGIGNINVSANSKTWIFGASGNLTLPGNTFAVNYANNQPVVIGSSGLPLSNGTSNINIATADGNVTITANGSPTWTFGTNNILTLPGGPRIVPVGANLELQAAAGGYAEITDSTGNSYVSVDSSGAQIVTNAANTWTFNNTGALIFPSGAEITSDNTGAAVFQHEGGVTIAETNGNSLTYNSVLELFDNAIHIGTDQQGAAYSWDFSQDGSMTVPGNISGANAISANVYTAPGSVSITSSGNTWTFNTDGNTVFPTLSTQRGDVPSGTITGQTLLFGDYANEAIITTPNGVLPYWTASQRLVINPGAGAANTSGEGGDIYLWAGRGGNASGTGGDIKIRGGQGGASDAGGIGGAGGYVLIEAGDAGFYDAGTGASAGYIGVTGGSGGENQPGGYVSILGGQGGSDVNYGLGGGDANIQGGYGRVNGTGGNVNIIGGQAQSGLTYYGNVNIAAGATTWQFNNDGNLIVPGSITNFTGGENTQGGTVQLIAGSGGSGGSGIAGGNANITGGFGRVAGHGGNVNITGGLAEGGTSAYGNVNISSGANTWVFNNDGNLTLPSGANVVSGYPGQGYIANTSVLSGEQVYLSSFNGNAWVGVENGIPVIGSTPTTIWSFNADGTTHFPGNIIDTGNVTIIQTPNGVPGNVTAITGSSGSWEANPVTDLATTGGTGTGLTVNVTQDGGYASAIAIATPGNGYTNGDTISVVSGSSSATFTISVEANQWTFGTDGVLTVPGEGVINSVNDTVTLRSFNTSTGNANSVYLGTSGGLGFQDTAVVSSNWLEIFRSNADPQIGTPGNLFIRTDSTNTAPTWTFDTTGNLTLPGSLVLAPNTIITGVGASPAPSINGFGTISAITLSASGNVTANNISLTGNGFVSFTSGSTLTFGDTPVTNRYYVDATRTSETYVRNGSQARPFNTIAAAQSAIATAIAGGLNPEVEPIYIILLSNITENVTLATNHVYLVGQNGQIHQPIILTGNVVVQPTAGTLNSNHFSISGIEVVGGTDGKAIYVTGTFPTRLSLQDMWITANGNSGAGLYQDNTGTGTYTHGGPIKVSHNGTGDVYCFDIRKGTASFESVETSGATQVGAAGPGATMTFNNSQLDANGDVVVETYGNGVVVVTNSVIKNSAANSYGIKLNAVANVAGTVSVGQSAFNVPLGTGQAVWLDPNTTPGLSGVFAWSGASFYPNTNTTIAPLAIPGPLAVLVGTIASPILYGDITSYAVAQDWDLIDNNASALSFDTTGKTGVLELVTTNSAEGVKMSGFASVAGNVTGGNISTAGLVKTGSFVTGTIPAAAGAGAGARAFVTDADSVTFGNLYVGGSSNAMPVWSNGTNWYIG